MEVLAAGADEVSAAVADLFGAHAQAYQALSAQAALFHEPFVHAMTAGAGAYAGAEAADAAALDVLNGPFQALFGRPLIGDGANGAPGQPRARRLWRAGRQRRYGRNAGRAERVPRGIAPSCRRAGFIHPYELYTLML